MKKFDIAIIGGGILGTSISYWISSIFDYSVCVIEKESSVAQHTSGRNTGVVHTPFYLDPEKKKIFAKTANISYDMWKKLAKKGNSHKFIFPISKLSNYNVSYSGVKTAFINFLHKNKLKNKNFIDENLNDICASIQKNLVDNLLNKVELLSNENNLKTIVFGGGVSANSYLKTRMKNVSKINNWEVYIPKLEYSTDNAAMIGIVGHLKYKDSMKSSLTSTPDGSETGLFATRDISIYLNISDRFTLSTRILLLRITAHAE